MVPNLENLCLKVAELARTTGEFVRNESKNFDISKIEHKGPSDMVSYVDKETEIKLVKGLTVLFPEAAFITEESTVEQVDKEFKWVIDPLDGTTNFLHGLPNFSISIALMQHSTLLIGVVYEVNLDECFYAWKDGGAYLNGKKITVSPIDKIKESLLASGFPYSQLDKSDNHFEILKELQDLSHGIRRFGSAAVDLAYVACGRFQAYYEFNLNIWDIAAGILIVQEAGGTICDFENGDDYMHGKEILAAGPVKDQVLEVIQKYWNN
jgi:myo-inositol-1(or 4)-monophosphatase